MPGLVGGHCIGIDPYYLTYKAEQVGYHSQVILSGRRINDDMGKYIAENVVKNLIKAEAPVRNARVAVLGLTFKENCPDTRNTKVIDIINELKEYDINPVICDPIADKDEAKKLYGIEFEEINNLKDMDAVVIAVAHDVFKKMTLSEIDRLFLKKENNKKVIVDVKGILDRKTAEKENYRYWRL